MVDQAGSNALSNLADRIAIQDVICAVSLHSDLDEREGIMAQYTDDAVMDFSSVFADGGIIPVSEHRARADGFMPGFDARQHQITNFQITLDGDTATARSQVRATHVIGKEAWIVGALYTHSLRRTGEGWKIYRQATKLAFQEGEHLIARAAEIVAQRLAGAKDA